MMQQLAYLPYGVQVWACGVCRGERQWGCGQPSPEEAKQTPTLLCEGTCKVDGKADYTVHTYVRVELTPTEQRTI